MNAYSTSLFIFRRDLRLNDNTALREAMRCSRQVIACFVFDPCQIEPHPYQSKPGLQFMLQSIDDLGLQLQAAGGKLNLLYMPPEQVVIELVRLRQIQAVFINRDYSPFSRQRDERLADVCQNLGIAWHSYPDILLNEPEHVLKSDQSVYKVFTAYYNNARQIPVAMPKALDQANFLALDSDFSVEQLNIKRQDTVVKGGRGEALAILARLDCYADYRNQRDFPALNATSKLSAHLKFGTCSVREAYYAITDQLGNEHPLIRQLYWRDFFTYIGYHFPQVFGQPFLEKFANLDWDNDGDYFQAWCEGKTGFPIVDAGMRELNATGYMHNRVRMIVASFLVKDMHIDWRWGERYFAQNLVDYDPCINNGNWQWAASTGCDAQPYFRIFNPWLQQIKFDPECRYICRWIPELQTIPAKSIHQWHKKQTACGYPASILDHVYESQLTKAKFKKAANL